MNEKAEVLISTKSWHYRLMKLVLGKMSPTPQDMHNLCPYFWLLMFCLLSGTVVLPLKYLFIGFEKMMDGLSNMIESKMIKPAAQKWYDKLTGLEAFAIFWENAQIARLYKTKFSHTYNGKKDFVAKWWESKYGQKAYLEGTCNRTKAFDEWVGTYMAEYEALNYTKVTEPSKFAENMENVRDNVGTWFDNAGDTMMSWKTLIKWTKRVVGLIITGIGLFISFFVINFLSRPILYLIEHWDWKIIGSIGIGAVIAAIGVGLIYLLSKWISVIQANGLKLWYVKLVYWPLYTCVYMPLKIVFYYFIWELLMVNLWFLLSASGKLAWKSLLSFLGIFGEYMGASYTDYCPGLKWKEEK